MRLLVPKCGYQSIRPIPDCRRHTRKRVQIHAPSSSQHTYQVSMVRLPLFHGFLTISHKTKVAETWLACAKRHSNSNNARRCAPCGSVYRDGFCFLLWICYPVEGLETSVRAFLQDTVVLVLSEGLFYAITAWC